MERRDRHESRVRISTQPWGTRVELCAPQVRNALDPATVSALADVFADDAPGSVLLCAQGPVFCAGGDVAVLAHAAAGGNLAELLATNAAAFADLVRSIVACPRPVIAAVGGVAVGGGASLALACDVRLATPQAGLVLAWGRWGLPPDGGASALMSFAVGPAAARSMLVSGATIEATSPWVPSVFSRVVPADALDREAVALAAELADAPGARAAKAVVTAELAAPLRAQIERELAELSRAAADPTVVERLALLYKM